MTRTHQLGRFTSADEPFTDQSENNPQSWNLYAYARNNPLNLVDPLGMAVDCPPGSPSGCYERDGQYFYKGEDGTETIYDPNPIRIETKEKRNSGVTSTMMVTVPCPSNGCGDVDVGILPTPMGAVESTAIRVIRPLVNKILQFFGVKIGSNAVPVVNKLAPGANRIFKDALKRARSKSGSFQDNLTALTEAVIVKNPSNQVWRIGNLNGSPVYGQIRSGVGIVEQNGKTFIVQKNGLSDNAFKIIDEFKP